MIGERLRHARTSVGLSLRTLAEQVGLSHATIKKYEDGKAMPSSSTLLKLAQALGVHVEYFFRASAPELENLEFRKRKSLSTKQLKIIKHKVLDGIERHLELERLFPIAENQSFTVPTTIPRHIAHIDDIEDVAIALRQAWSLGVDPIPCLVDVLEAFGVRVLLITPDEDKKFDGLASSIDGKPLVVVSTRWPGDRQRFTLAHELGHLVLHGRLATSIDEEKACNRFAGAFLFPRDAVLFLLGEKRKSFELKELALLKQDFGLSMQGIFYRAYDLGIITSNHLLSLQKLFAKQGWKKCEPGLAYPSESTQLFTQRVLRAYSEEVIGEAKAAELLGISITQLQKDLNLEPVHADAHQ